MNARCFIKLLDSRTFVWTTSQLLIGENYKTPQVTLYYVEKNSTFCRSYASYIWTYHSCRSWCWDMCIWFIKILMWFIKILLMCKIIQIMLQNLHKNILFWGKKPSMIYAFDCCFYSYDVARWESTLLERLHVV